MKIGSQIKKFRTEGGMTQKELADRLKVSAQAVSRWENDEVEPSIDTLNAMADIFNVSMNDLFGRESAPTAAVESVPPLCLCEGCNTPLYNTEDIHRMERAGRSCIYCKECYDNLRALEMKEKKVEAERRADEAKLKAAIEAGACRRRRIHSYVWSGLAAVLWLVLCIALDGVGVGLVGGVMIFCAISCAILDNNFILDMWLGITSWSFRAPGIIFTFDLDGFIFLIGMKLLFWAIGAALSFLAGVLATALALALSPFVYPFALYRAFHGEID